MHSDSQSDFIEGLHKSQRLTNLDNVYRREKIKTSLETEFARFRKTESTYFSGWNVVINI